VGSKSTICTEGKYLGIWVAYSYTIILKDREMLGTCLVGIRISNISVQNAPKLAHCLMHNTDRVTHIRKNKCMQVQLSGLVASDSRIIVQVQTIIEMLDN